MYKYLKCLETAYAHLSLGKVETISRKWNRGIELTYKALHLTINWRTHLLWLALIALLFFIFIFFKVIINLWCLWRSYPKCLRVPTAHMSYLKIALCIYDCLFYSMNRNTCFIKYYKYLKKLDELDVAIHLRTCEKNSSSFPMY